MSRQTLEVPFRPPFEFIATLGWMIGGSGSIAVMMLTSLPKFPVEAAVALCALMAALRAAQGYVRWREIKRLNGFELEFITHQQLVKLAKPGLSKETDYALWIGKGFRWDNECARRANEIIQRGPSSIGEHLVNEGEQWVHGLAPKEEDLFLQANSLVGHTLIVGTTRVGKTRLLDILVNQLAIRGTALQPGRKKFKREAIIIIDPKGDHATAENIRRLCVAMGEGDRFVYFNPAFPEKSDAIDPMYNFNRPTELASRVAALIPSETGSDPFTAFSWKALNDISFGLLMLNQRPNLVRLRQNIEAGIEQLLEQVLRTYLAKNVPNYESEVHRFIASVDRDNRRGGQVSTVDGLIKFMRQHVAGLEGSKDRTLQVINGLINCHTHERTHYQKMTASLIPILTMLTSGHMGDLLSPEPEHDPTRRVTDIATIVERGQILYLALDTLSDSTVGPAIGAMFLSDITAVIGDRYNNNNVDTNINVFIDEAAEVINNAAIQLLNKGGGANLRVFMCTQTFADFEHRTGSEAAARKVLGNVNNTFVMRLQDTETRDNIAAKFPEINVATIDRSYSSGASADDPVDFHGGYSESLKQTKAPLVPPSILMTLPKLQYFASLSDGRIIKGRIPILSVPEDAK